MRGLIAAFVAADGGGEKRWLAGAPLLRRRLPGYAGSFGPGCGGRGVSQVLPHDLRRIPSSSKRAPQLSEQPLRKPAHAAVSWCSEARDDPLRRLSLRAGGDVARVAQVLRARPHDVRPQRLSPRAAPRLVARNLPRGGGVADEALQHPVGDVRRAPQPLAVVVLQHNRREGAPEAQPRGGEGPPRLRSGCGCGRRGSCSCCGAAGRDEKEPSPLLALSAQAGDAPLEEEDGAEDEPAEEARERACKRR